MLPHIGVALYGDYCYSDYTDVLPKIDIPVLILSGNSGIFPESEKQGAWMQTQILDAELVTFKKGGHMLFWGEAEKFNKALDEFAQNL